MNEIECRLTQDLPAGYVLLPDALEQPILHRNWVGEVLARNVAAGSILSPDDVLPLQDEQTLPLYEFLNESGAMDQIVSLDRRTFDELGTVYVDEPWTAANFEYPLPGKSELSFVIVRGSDLIGFWIGSERVTGEAHGHRQAVEPSRRNGRIARRYWCAFWRAAVARQGIWRMTGEVSVGNVRVRKLLASLGYRSVSPQETKDYLKAHGRDEVTDGVEIIGASGRHSIVMVRPIEREN